MRLFAKRVDVDLLNREKIAQLPSNPIVYRCVDHFKWQEHHRGEKGLEKNTRPGDFGTLLVLVSALFETAFPHIDQFCRKIIDLKFSFN